MSANSPLFQNILLYSAAFSDLNLCLLKPQKAKPQIMVGDYGTVLATHESYVYKLKANTDLVNNEPLLLGKKS